MLEQDLKNEIATMYETKKSLLAHLNACEGSIISAEALLKKYFLEAVKKVEEIVHPATPPDVPAQE